jgi:alkyl sulfatase BDS1-like metallo-beta-lactamase superfamily hydrolase
MGEILDLAEALWSGEKNTYTHHPFGPPRGIEQIAQDTWFYKGFANTIIRQTDDGLIIIDPAATWDTKLKFEAVRSVSTMPLNTAIYTHGHVDHVFGIPEYAEEAKAKGVPRPRVIAHQAVPARFRRYRESVAWNAFINLRQFRGGVGEPMFPEEFYYPDTTYTDQTTIRVGKVTAHLKHARGETDDHSWLFFPDTRVLCTGDLFIYAVPNAGNPQKVQRYAMEWAAALREMSALEPKVLAPGHGFPIWGAERVKQALEETASFLESIHGQTIALMNKGVSLDTVLHTVKAPEELLNRPYLRPVYDETEFIVRNIWRLYGGWYSGTPSQLKPAPEKAQAQEIAHLAGGADKLAARAKEALKKGDLRMACHLVDWAYLASPASKKINEAAEKIYNARAEAESSTMAIGIFRAAAREMGQENRAKMPDGKVIQTQTERGKDY